MDHRPGSMISERPLAAHRPFATSDETRWRLETNGHGRESAGRIVPLHDDGSGCSTLRVHLCRTAASFAGRPRGHESYSGDISPLVVGHRPGKVISERATARHNTDKTGTAATGMPASKRVASQVRDQAHSTKDRGTAGETPDPNRMLGLLVLVDCLAT